MFADHDVKPGPIACRSGSGRFVSSHECRFVAQLPAGEVGLVRQVIDQLANSGESPRLLLDHPDTRILISSHDARADNYPHLASGRDSLTFTLYTSTTLDRFCFLSSGEAAVFLERRQPDPSYSGTAATAQSFRTARSRGRGSAYTGARPTCRTQTSDQFELAGAADRFAAVSRRQLSVDVPEMSLDGVDGDVHLASDLGRVQQA